MEALPCLALSVFPLAFSSSVFVPTQTMPAWLQPFAANQPVTVATNALRGLILSQGALPAGHTAAGQVALALAWSAAITTVFAPPAIRRYRRTTADPNGRGISFARAAADAGGQCVTRSTRRRRAHQATAAPARAARPTPMAIGTTGQFPAGAERTVNAAVVVITGSSWSGR
jgi:hypothetical protein